MVDAQRQLAAVDRGTQALGGIEAPYAGAASPYVGLHDDWEADRLRRGGCLGGMVDHKRSRVGEPETSETGPAGAPFEISTAQARRPFTTRTPCSSKWASQELV